ncbi:hypothetical protein CCACVL1_19302 [Corchorus capsularis]|uniref:Uncharacterized protein n=1 Tax=Corchorus capsularis TaxID=210143 RepID=A0A1R3HHI0_COCAP|nr:hypothetical protein CCACVL1_19302 [Corchorus capsularis]
MTGQGRVKAAKPQDPFPNPTK